MDVETSAWGVLAVGMSRRYVSPSLNDCGRLGRKDGLQFSAMVPFIAIQENVQSLTLLPLCSIVNAAAVEFEPFSIPNPSEFRGSKRALLGVDIDLAIFLVSSLKYVDFLDDSAE